MIEIHENSFRFLEFHGYLPSGYSNYSIIDHLFGISIHDTNGQRTNGIELKGFEPIK